MDRNAKIPEKLPQRDKKKYLNMLVGKKEFLPKLVNTQKILNLEKQESMNMSSLTKEEVR